ncbi:MAG: DoxX family protein [Patescibacteria group bacterium]
MLETVMNKCHSWCGHRYSGIAARVFLSALFIIVGFNKLMNFSATAQFVGSAGIPMPEVMTVLAIVFELGGGLMLLFGFRKRLAIAMLVVFTAVATALFHLRGLATDQTQMVMFLKNLAIIGGLLALYKGCGCGHGGCSSCSGKTCENCGPKE